MTGPLYALGRLAARRHWIFIGAWIVIVVGLVVAGAIAGKPTSDDLTLPGSDSTRATDLLDDRLPSRANGTVPIALESSRPLDEGQQPDRGQGDRPGLQGRLARPHRDQPAQRGGGRPAQQGRQDRLHLAEPPRRARRARRGGGRLPDRARRSGERAGIDVAAGAYLGQEVSKPATESSELIGLAVAVVVLAFAFGTLVAMPLPIVTAIFGLAAGLSLAGLLGHLIEVPSVAATLGTMLGLGVGIDYALFIVTRYRGFLDSGIPGRGVGGAGDRDVRWARSCSPAAPSSSRCSRSTSEGSRSSARWATRRPSSSRSRSSRRPPCCRRSSARSASGSTACACRSASTPADDHPHGWARWAREIGKRPLAAAVVGLLVLVGLAVPLLDISLGQPDNGQLPKDTETRQSYDILSKGFGPGTNGPAAGLGPARSAGEAGHQEAQPGRGEAEAPAAAGQAEVRAAGGSVPGGGPGGRGDRAASAAGAAAAGRADREAAAGGASSRRSSCARRPATRG